MLKNKLIELLDRDEPDYKSAANLGAESLPYLLKLIKKGGARLAPRAVYTASLINDEKVSELLSEGTNSSIVDVRVAVAAAIRNRPQLEDTNTMRILLNDTDVGVRKVTLKSIAESDLQNHIINSELKRMVETESNAYVRSLADKVYRGGNH